MAPPEVELIVNFTIRVITPHEQLRLFKVGKRPEGIVEGPRVIAGGKQIFQVSRVPQNCCEILSGPLYPCSLVLRSLLGY